jgi:hypothetical protein
MVMSETDSRNAIERVWARVQADPRSALEQRLGPSDLQTLLMSVTKSRASAVTAARLMQRWEHDRFVRPAPSDPRAVWRVETRLWELLPADFDGLDLSPVAPLATCSAVAPVDQHRVISTTRASEVVSDSTNVLALEAARRRKQNPDQPVHLAACHRVIRAQPFSGEGLFQHFRIFALLSSARDQGSGRTEAAMLSRHLDYWIRSITDMTRSSHLTLEFTSFDSPVLLERFNDTVLDSLLPLPEHVRVREDPTRQRARGYYNLGAIRVVADEELEIGDGGFTDWTAQLMADKKERCLISCVGTERLATLAADR